MNGHKIEPTDHIKYLGIYLDSTLSGKQHCDILCAKLKRANGMLSKIRHYLPKKELKSIYYAIFNSHMISGCQIWGQTQNVHNNKISLLQNRALRIINFKDFRADANPLYKDTNVLKLQSLVSVNNCLFVHDYLTNSLPTCFDDYYFRLNSLYLNMQTRNANLGCLFQPSRKTTKYGLNSITQKSINTWNYISQNANKDLLSLSRYSLNKFLTEFFLNQY